MGVIFPIVEGHGELTAVPALIRRILFEKLQVFDFNVLPPYRVPRSKIGKFDRDLENAIRIGMLKVGKNSGGVIIIADSDDDCPLELNQQFCDFCVNKSIDFPVSFVLAHREYEAWFISCGEEMRGHAAIKLDAPSHDYPETIRGAKGFFNREILIDGYVYSETVDQAKFTNSIDLEVASLKCRSFRKLIKEIENLTLV